MQVALQVYHDFFLGALILLRQQETRARVACGQNYLQLFISKFYQREYFRKSHDRGNAAVNGQFCYHRLSWTKYH